MTCHKLTAEPIYERYNDLLRDTPHCRRGPEWRHMDASANQPWIVLALHLWDVDLPVCTGAQLYGMVQQSGWAARHVFEGGETWWPNWDTLDTAHCWVWEQLAVELYPPQPFEPGELQARIRDLLTKHDVGVAWHNFTVEVNDRIEAGKLSQIPKFKP